MGFGGTMIVKRTDQGTFGILVMTNVGAMFLENDRRIDWYTNYYFELEQLLLQAAEEMSADRFALISQGNNLVQVIVKSR